MQWKWGSVREGWCGKLSLSKYISIYVSCRLPIQAGNAKLSRFLLMHICIPTRSFLSPSHLLNTRSNLSHKKTAWKQCMNLRWFINGKQATIMMSYIWHRLRCQKSKGYLKIHIKNTFARKTNQCAQSSKPTWSQLVTKTDSFVRICNSFITSPKSAQEPTYRGGRWCTDKDPQACDQEESRSESTWSSKYFFKDLLNFMEHTYDKKQLVCVFCKHIDVFENSGNVWGLHLEFAETEKR